ncbi:MAG TPA: TIGR03435 family protein [Terracidiphilus sp.]|nr:TIGR03435 family protein [Terracidiphilus sp.]
MRAGCLWRFLFIAGVSLSLLPERAISQSTPEPRKAAGFEVASIRLNPNPNQGWRMEFTPDGLRAMNVTLQYVLHDAFGVYDDRLWSDEPKWILEKRFDINAKFDLGQDPHPTLEQRRGMLQRLLADRFKLVVHHERREFALYALVQAKRGEKFAEAKPQDQQKSATYGVMCTVTGGGKGAIEMRGCTVADLANDLNDRARFELSRKVVDETGLTGRYNIALHWTPVDTGGPTSPQSNPSDAESPPLITALKEQLGLELRPTKGLLDTIVVDHIEMPSEN